MRAAVIALIILQICAVFKCQQLPQNIQKCNYGDLRCIVKSMNSVIKSYYKGSPEIGLIPMDSVHVPDFELWNNKAQGGVWFKFNLFNQVNQGFENTTITKVRGFGRDPTAETMEIYGRIPSLIHRGNFRAKGRSWPVDINSTGTSFSDFQSFRFILKLKVVTEYRNNARYLKIYDLVPNVNMKRWILLLEDLFKDNSDMTNAINTVFNANWLEFYNEMEPILLNTFKRVFTSLIEGFFEKIPYDEMFL